MSSAGPDPKKRPYLRPAARKRQLLDATTAVVRRDGLGGLTMVAVAAEAGVSRRLLYNHYPDLATLAHSYVIDRLSSYAEESATVFEDPSRTPRSVGRQIFERLAQLPVEDRQVLRTLLARAVPADLLPVSALLEQTIIERWSRVRPDGEVGPFDGARALLLANVALSAIDLVERGVLDETGREAFFGGVIGLLPGNPS